MKPLDQITPDTLHWYQSDYADRSFTGGATLDLLVTCPEQFRTKKLPKPSRLERSLHVFLVCATQREGIDLICAEGLAKPLQRVTDPELTPEDKDFLCDVMQFDFRDRPTAQELLKHKWFAQTVHRAEDFNVPHATSSVRYAEPNTHNEHDF